MSQRATLAVVLIVALVAFAPLSTGISAAVQSPQQKQDFSLSPSIPSKTTVGQSNTIGATASVPDLAGSYETDVTFILYVDGSQVDAKSLSVTDGETVDATFSYTFDNSGTHDVRVEASTSFAGQTFSDSASGSISVSPPDVGPMDLSVSAPSSAIVDETITVSNTVSLPDVSGTDVSGDITVTLDADGSTVASQTVTLSDGQSKTVDLSASFNSASDVSLTSSASGTIAGQSLTADVARTLTVEQPSIDSLSLRADVPSSTTVGESTTASVSVGLPEVSTDVSGDITVKIKEGGQTIAQDTVTVADGTSETSSLSLSFASAGDKSLAIEASGTVAGQSVSKSVTKSITVEPESVESVAISVDAPGSVTAGESPDVSATVDVPSVSGADLTADLSVSLFKGGEQIGTQMVTLGDGESTTVTFSPTFDSTGDVSVTTEVTGMVGPQEVSESVTRTITVEEAPTTEISVTSDLSVPETVTVGGETQIDGSVSLSNVPDTVTPTVTVELLANGTVVASQELLVGDSGESISFSPTFENSGDTEITLRVTGTVADQEISDSLSRVVTIGQPGDSLERSGVVFKTPESLEDEVEAYREDLNLDGSLNTFVLAEENQLTVVFTNTEPKKGVATVTGRTTNRSLSYDGFTLDVAVATAVEYDQTGESTTVQSVHSDPDAYRLNLVEISTEHRRVSVLADPDQGDDITAVTTVGALIGNPQSATNLFEDGTQRARTLAQNPNESTINQVLENPEEPYLPTFSFEERYWSSAPATVDGVILNPSSQAYEFAVSLDSNGVIAYDGGTDTPILYVVDTQLASQTFDSVADVKSNADQLDGEEVTITGRLYRSRVSVQETAEHATTSQCNEDLLTVQTPNGPACVNVAADVLADGGVLWTTVPESRDDILLVFGLSSAHQDKPLTNESGRFEITGELVSTSRINESLPEGSVLVVHEATKVESIDYDAVGSEARNLIEERADKLRAFNRQSSITDSDGENSSDGVSTETRVDLNPDETGGVSEVRLKTTAGVSASVSVNSVSSVPPDVLSPPVEAVAVYDISASVDDSDVEGATVTAELSAGDVDDPRSLSVYRYHDGEWNELPTRVGSQSGSTITLEFDTVGFSYFVVGESSGEDEQVTTLKDETTDEPESTTNGAVSTTTTSGETLTGTAEQTNTSSGEMPGFGMAAALIALVLVGYRLRNR